MGLRTSNVFFDPELLGPAEETPAFLLPPEEAAGKLQAIRNDDGTFSSERTITVGIDDRFFNIPTIVNGRPISGSSDPSEITDAAVKHAESVGIRRFPNFGTIEEATAAASNRSTALGIAGSRNVGLNLPVDLSVFTPTAPSLGGGRAQDPVAALEQDSQLDLASILAQSSEAAKPIVDQLIPPPAPMDPTRATHLRRAALFGAVAGQKAGENPAIQAFLKAEDDRKRTMERRETAQVRLTGDLARDSINSARQAQAKKEAAQTAEEKELRAMKVRIASSGVATVDDLPDNFDDLLPVLSEAARAEKDQSRLHDLHTFAIKNGIVLDSMSSEERQDALEFSAAMEGGEDIEGKLKRQQLRNAELTEQAKLGDLAEANQDTLVKLGGVRRSQRQIEAVFIRELSGFFSTKTFAEAVASDFKGINRAERLKDPFDSSKKVTYGSLIQTYKDNMVLERILKGTLAIRGLETEGEFEDPSAVDVLFQDAVEANQTELAPVQSPEVVDPAEPTPAQPSVEPTSVSVPVSEAAAASSGVTEALANGLQSILEFLGQSGTQDERIARTKTRIDEIVASLSGKGAPRSDDRSILGPKAKDLLGTLVKAKPSTRR